MSTDTDPAPRTSRNPAFAERLAASRRRLSAAVLDFLVALPLSLDLAVAAVATRVAGRITPAAPVWAADRTTGSWRRTGVRAGPILAGIAAYRGSVHQRRAQFAGRRHRRLTVAGIATSDDEGRRVAAQPV
ncbi:hypothetical protein [Nocardia brasiliensis]|uniref:hypothetical protein n=1 Tax=Nocardia brasiliensis TaxID=37326 RepID=UPI0036703C8D